MSRLTLRSLKTAALAFIYDFVQLGKAKIFSYMISLS